MRPAADDEYPTIQVLIPVLDPGSDPAPVADMSDAGEGGPIGDEDVAFRTITLPTPPPPAALTGSGAASLLYEDYIRRPARLDDPGSDALGGRGGSHGSDGTSGLIRPRNLFHSASGGSHPSVPAARLPNPGDRLFGFVLRRELGRGSFARVFLAEQTDLAGRPVVLKVSGLEGREPQTLAQLQHTNIVPIFSLHDDARAGLRALCMPYFGGASLSQVLEAAWERDAPAGGSDLIAALDRVAPPAGAGPAVAGDRTPRAAVAGLDYTQACAWLVARLAEGLHHAHQLGVLHRDVKPANILLAGDGQPMLLDFNLAHDARAAQAHASLGGTVAYMSPEQLRAMADRNPVAARAVDHRSDIYSLGMVLYETLVGRSPFSPSASRAPLPLVIESLAVERARALPSARAARPTTPWGLESVLRKCLAPAPADRYQRADDLAEDLRRFLADQPLRHTPELSHRERVRKWVRRHPRLSSAGVVFAAAAVLLIGVGLVLAGVSGRLEATGDQLATARAQDRKRAYQEGAVRALILVNTTTDAADHLRLGARVCEETLDTYSVITDPNWQAHPDWLRLSADDRRELADDTRELLLLLAGARVRLAPGDPRAVVSAQVLLDRAEAIPDLPPCQALWEDRAAYRDQAGDAAGAAAARAAAAAIRPSTARDFYLLGMSAARAKRYDRAVAHLDRAVELNPRHYWSWLLRGLCHHDLGEPAVAAADFGTCVGLRPEFAWGYFNRGAVLAECGKLDEAVRDYSAVLRCDPDFVLAYVNRATLYLDTSRPASALADLRAAAARGRDDAALHAGIGAALERLGRHPAADEAFRAAEARTADLPAAARLRLRWAYGFAVALRKPDEARTAFDDVLRQAPGDPQALFGRGMLHERQGRDADALGYYDRALTASPGFAAARRARAVVLAREGRVDEAEREINACHERDPRSGATLYDVACVAALAARHFPPELAKRAADQAVEYLGRAFARGYGADRAAADRDLDAVRRDPRVVELIASHARKPEPGGD